VSGTKALVLAKQGQEPGSFGPFLAIDAPCQADPTVLNAYRTKYGIPPVPGLDCVLHVGLDTEKSAFKLGRFRRFCQLV
jgi:hypothetical protein